MIYVFVSFLLLFVCVLFIYSTCFTLLCFIVFMYLCFYDVNNANDVNAIPNTWHCL